MPGDSLDGVSDEGGREEMQEGRPTLTSGEVDTFNGGRTNTATRS